MTGLGGRAAVAVFTAALVALPASIAQAQASQCRIPGKPVSVPRIVPDGQPRRTPVTGYTLALSWSPEFCRTRKADRSHARQCSGNDGQFGLILHGLWPEGAGARYPQWCSAARQPSPETVRRQLCMMPSARMVAHEWAKHGSCMVRTPESYFKVSQILWKSLRLPDLDRLSRQDNLTVGDLRRAFVRANPAWDGRQIGVTINQRGWLREVRLCYGKDFMPTACGPRRLGPRNSTALRIWRGF
ncbi:MAG: ribonuclease T [Caenibius sp.]